MDCWVYMLQCADGSYHVGSARYSLDRRIGQHQSGEYGGYTSSRLPVKLVWSADFLSIRDAIACERQIKGWSRAKKQALIRGDFAEISLLARRASSFETAAARPPQDEEDAETAAAHRYADATGPQDEEVGRHLRRAGAAGSRNEEKEQ